VLVLWLDFRNTENIPNGVDHGESAIVLWRMGSVSCRTCC
jgi:hypothetical protein